MPDFYVGERVGKVWLGFWQESMIYPGYQAHMVLVLMEQGETERLREYLESEVDSALGLLESEDYKERRQSDYSLARFYCVLRSIERLTHW